MATTLQLRRGTAAEAAALTGAQGELFIDVDNKLVYLHDGVTAGGIQVGGTGGGAAVVSGVVSGNTLTLTNSDATTVNVNVATLAQDTDTNTYVTSATVNGSIITLHNNNGSTVNIQLPSSVTGFLPGEVSEDMVPQFDAVYDLGSPSERWYDVNVANSVSIGNATLKEVDGVLTVNAEIVANNLVGTDLVVDEALIGTNLHVGSTITPEGIANEYVDTKGTLTVDGNLSVLDDLSVRNKISLKQSPVAVGAVSSLVATQAQLNTLTIDNSYASSIGLLRFWLTSNGNTQTASFNTVSQAAAFAATIPPGTQLNFSATYNGSPVQGVLQVTANYYSQGSTAVDFGASLVSGQAPWDVSSWTDWWYPWATSSAAQMTSIVYNTVVPASYSVYFDHQVPALGNINKLFLNNSSTIVDNKSFSNLSQFAVYVSPANGMYFNNFTFYNDGGINGFVISTMGGGSEYYNFIDTASEMVFTDIGTGITWTLAPIGLTWSNAYGNLYAYDVLSTSNPSYPTPYNVRASYSSNDASCAFTVNVDILSYLSSASTSVTGINGFKSNTDITSKFTVGDALSYTTKTTSIVFGDDTTGTKAITYDETTGKITYDGLVSALSINADRYALYSSNSLISTNNATPGMYSISLGNASTGGGEGGVAIGSSAAANSYHTVSVGYNARSSGNSTICVGGGDARGDYSTYVGRGGDGIGGMYHSTVLGMIGDGSSGWMWGDGQHVMTLGMGYTYINKAGDYSTVINGGSGTTSTANGNLIGGSTWFAPQDRHAELELSVYQYLYANGAGTVYPQLGYSSSSGVPYSLPNSARTSGDTTLVLTSCSNNALFQGKITVTVSRRNSDDYGIYEIAFIARRSNAGVSSIVSQTTTVIAQSNASTYWGNPAMFLSGDYLQLSMTTTASATGNYITVHVGGHVRISGTY